MKDYSIFGSILGSPYFGKPPYESFGRFSSPDLELSFTDDAFKSLLKHMSWECGQRMKCRMTLMVFLLLSCFFLFAQTRLIALQEEDVRVGLSSPRYVHY